MMKELRMEAKVENLQNALDFVDAQLEEMGCSMKAQMQVDIAVEEIYVNVAKYAYAPGTGEVLIGVESGPDNTIEILFSDEGVPYDPLGKDDPDVTLTVEERQIGGLGIFMAKKSMDEMRYEYRDGRNMLYLKKKLA